MANHYNSLMICVNLRPSVVLFFSFIRACPKHGQFLHCGFDRPDRSVLATLIARFALLDCWRSSPEALLLRFYYVVDTAWPAARLLRRFDGGLGRA